MKRLIFCLLIPGFLAGEALALEIWLEPVGTYTTGIFDDEAAQIVDYHAPSQQLFITNAADKTVDVLDISDPTSPTLSFVIGLPEKPLSVAVHPSLDMVAVSCEGDKVTDPGTVEFFCVSGVSLGAAIEVGALPDMLTFTPDGQKVLVANEGEPSDDYDVDPEGSVSIIDISEGETPQEMISNATVETAGFDGVRIDPRVRIFGPGATAAQDLEPEFIAVDHRSKFAWVTLQENNAIAKLNIDDAKFKWVCGLGYKDHSRQRNALDASDKDGGINIEPWPVNGMYQPDAIAAFTVRDRQYLITGNEGDARDYDGFSEEARAKDLSLDPHAFRNAEELQENENLGRLKVTTELGDVDGDGDYDELYSYGARSFSIWDEDGDLVFDSRDQLEQITASMPQYVNFNANNDENKPDKRSDDKGPEPEHVVVGTISGRTIAFIGLERIGGIMTYDVSNPHRPRFLDYVNNRDFGADPESPAAGDLGTEGLVFIPADKSPNGSPLVAAANEVSGTTTIFQVQAELP